MEIESESGLISTSSVGLMFPEQKKYHCTRGHQWEAFYMNSGISIQLPDSSITSSFCIYCLDEWAKDNLGFVVEDVQHG